MACWVYIYYLLKNTDKEYILMTNQHNKLLDYLDGTDKMYSIR